MGTLILVTGGVRSGKSRFAEALAEALGGDRVAYVATAEGGDAEMRRKIARHRAERPATWPTFEGPRDAAAACDAATAAAGGAHPPRVVLLDCLTMLVSNLLLAGDEAAAGERVERQVTALRAAIRRVPATVIVVTNEVGWGVVPAYSLGRAYRDLLGRANQALAAEAGRVYLVVAGLAVEVKALAQTPGQVAAALAPLLAPDPPENRP